MRGFKVYATTVLALGMACSGGALAAPISGTFAGIAFASRINATSPNPGNFDGQTVTGTFWVDIDNLPPPDAEEPGASFTVFDAGLMRITFSVPGQDTVVFDGSIGANAIFLQNTPGGQFVSLAPDFSFPYWFAGLDLVGDLFDGVDPKTLRAGPVDVASSSAYFFADRSFGGALDLTSVQFDNVSEVAEPHAVALFMSALALAAWARRRGSRGRGQ